MKQCMWMQILAAAAAIAAGPAAHAQGAAFPNKPVRLIISFTPGSATDIVGRIVAQKLSEYWGQPVVAENRPGAGGSIGSAVVVQSPPDGYTLLANSSAHASNPAIYAKLPYDTLKDFTNLSPLAGQPNVLIVGAGHGLEDARATSSPRRRRSPASSTSPRPASAAARTSTSRS